MHEASADKSLIVRLAPLTQSRFAYWVRATNTKKPAIRKFFPDHPATYIAKSPNMPPKADSIEIAIQNASAAMDADPTLKGTDAAKQYNAIYQQLIAWR